MKKVAFKNLGLISYKKAWDLQETLFKEIVDIKLKDRLENTTSITKNHLLFCEHPPVYTLGKSGEIQNLLLDESSLKDQNIDFYKINRGGDITFHGPGQLVAYPILNLDYFFTDIHLYLRKLEDAIIKVLAHYNIEGDRLEGFTGVWLEPGIKNKERKICAMGVKASRWVTMHGLALNVNTDLSYFDNIIPCGIDDKAVTSIEKEIGRKVELEEVQELLLKYLIEIFEIELI